jgi:hypothetical protein
MSILVTSGDDSQSVDKPEKWEDILIVPGTLVVDYIILINEGDFPGMFRLVEGDKESPAARLPAGPGEPGQRRSAINIPCVGFSGGSLQVKKIVGEGHVTGLWAWAGK